MNQGSPHRRRLTPRQQASTSTLVLAALALCVFARDAEAAKGTTKLAVLELKASNNDLAPTARTLTSALTQSLARDGGLEVIASSDLKAMLDLKAKQAVLGCDDDKCFYDMASTLAVDQLVTGEVGRLGGETLVFVTLLDLKGQRALARTSATLNKGGDAVASMKQLAIALTQPDAVGADVPLSTLRIALLVDEYDGEGEPIVRRPIETCLNKALLKAGATPLNAAAVRAHTGKTGVREILAGGLPDGLTPADVDAVLLGAADYVEKVGQSKKIGKGVMVQADFAFQLVLVSSGEVIASDEVTGTGKHFRAAAAIKRVASRACKKVTPALESALTRRVDRGRRVQLVIEGVADAAAAQALVQTLKTTSGVGRARLISFADGKAAVDVWVVRGDGVRLAFALGEKGKLSLTNITRDRLSARVGG